MPLQIYCPTPCKSWAEPATISINSFEQDIALIAIQDPVYCPTGLAVFFGLYLRDILEL